MKEVLVVDDDEDIRTVLAEFLSYEGFSVTSAGDGLEALSILGGGARPSVILLDLKMPGMNGVQFREAQRGDPAISGIPVIVITADGDAEAKAAAVQAQGLVRKPVDLDDLVTQVRRVAG